MSHLVIVESPAKARTINKYLGRGYTVKASMGHVRDLPKSRLGVDVDRGFELSYEVLPARRKVMDELRKAANDAEDIFLAADPDREGEAICWHLAQELGGRRDRPPRKFKRVVFHEITKGAIQKAFEHPAELNLPKVDAQQARRVLDRLVGYKVSPILWERIRGGLSAGRVQSVALRLICEREREILAFVPEEYWSVTAHLDSGAPPVFPAGLWRKNGAKIEVKNEAAAKAVRADLEKATYVVSKVTRKERKRYPVPPFITSKLQQEAFRKLRFPVKKTMQVAQKLYEGLEVGDRGSVGLITYMRTDSTRVSDEALAAVRGHIASVYGADSLPEKAVSYKTKDSAQDAHEAIRPTDLSLTPAVLRRHLGKDELALYELIWNRFVASQMKPAVFDETAVEITAGEYMLRARGVVTKFKGFLAVYEEAAEEPAKGKAKKAEAKGAPASDTAVEAEAPEAKEGLPPLAVGQALRLRKLDTAQRFTEPPPRFSEASLVKELEENGVGRPSTYASIIATIEARDYIEKRAGRLWPTETGFVVTDLLVENFADIMSVDYTAAMEKELDEIEAGKDTFLNTLNQFWRKFEESLKTASRKVRPGSAGNDGKEKPGVVCDKCGSGMVEKSGRYGAYLSCSRYPACTATRNLTGAAAGEREPATPRLIANEFCPECRKPLACRTGRFGDFAACSGYPVCKFIRKKEAKAVGLLCPQCHEGQIVERSGRFGKPFYGCRRYPQCKFTSFHRPLAEPCPSCARPYLLQRESKKSGWVVGCSDDACGYERPLDGPPSWAIEAARAAAIVGSAREAVEIRAAKEAH